MSKKFVVGLIVAFVVAAALPLVGQAQSNCKYVGPANPLSLTTVATPQTGSFTLVKTVSAQKELFYCYSDAKSVPDDKTLQDPLANRDKIAKNLQYIVEIEVMGFFIQTYDETGFDAEYFGERAVRCVKKRVTELGGGTTIETWIVDNCTSYARVDEESDDPADIDLVFDGVDQNLPEIPATAARGCAPEFVQDGKKKASKQPYLGGPIPLEDPTDMNMVPIDLNGDGLVEFIKMVKVNKEVFRCFTSGSLDSPAIYDIHLFISETEEVDDDPPFVEPEFIHNAYHTFYCAKKEKEAILLGCSWKSAGEAPFVEGKGKGDTLRGSSLLPAALRPFVTLTSAGVRPSAGQVTFEAQGYNIEGLQVQVYNLAGKQVFSAEASGNSLSWNGLSSDGRRLANGVYLYVLTVKGTYGDIVQTKVQKLAILR